MTPKIAIPMPHSLDREYAERAIPQYERAVELAGGQPVRIRFEKSAREIETTLIDCAAVLLPGSRADVAPEKFGAEKSPQTAQADPRREATDELLLRHAYERRKPVLGICYGLQSLNVFRGGSLIQHIPDFLPDELRTKVNHSAGKTVAVGHQVTTEKASMLSEILCGSRAQPFNEVVQIPVNSSHHQSAHKIGTGLRIVARCPDDGIIEALEGADSGHFVLAVQWHPERSVDHDENSRAIFSALVEAARNAID